MAKASKDNKYTYKIKGGTVSGYFDIYQAKSGHIMILMGNSVTQLSRKQVEDLKIDVYDLPEFDHDDFQKAYAL